MNIENLEELKKVSSDIFEVSQNLKHFIIKYKL